MWCGQTLILMMAAITSISPSLYESAVIDGANDWQCTWKITVPLLRPMMFFVLVTSMVGGMQMFDIPFLITGMHGEPDYKIRTSAVYMYNIGFQGKTNYSYAAAISVGVFIITTVLAVFINKITAKCLTWAIINGFCINGIDMTVHHHSCIAKRTIFLSFVKSVRNLLD